MVLASSQNLRVAISRWRRPLEWWRERRVFQDQLNAWRSASGGSNDRYQKFLILTTARSGSNWLTAALNSHAQIACYGEVFHPEAIYGALPRELRSSRIALNWRDANPARFLRNQVYGGKADCLRACGFKIFYEHLERPVNRRLRDVLVRDAGIKVLSLTRQCLLASLVSHKRAQISREWIDIGRGELQSRDPKPLHLGVEECEAFFRRKTELRNRYLGAFSRHSILHLKYEDLARDFDQATAPIFAWLGVEAGEVKQRTKKQSAGSVAESVSNYDEIQSHFRGTEFESFVD